MIESSADVYIDGYGWKQCNPIYWCSGVTSHFVWTLWWWLIDACQTPMPMADTYHVIFYWYVFFIHIVISDLFISPNWSWIHCIGNVISLMKFLSVLSKWQLPVQPVMKISSKWHFFHFCICIHITNLSQTTKYHFLLTKFCIFYPVINWCLFISVKFMMNLRWLQ